VFEATFARGRLFLVAQKAKQASVQENTITILDSKNMHFSAS